MPKRIIDFIEITPIGGTEKPDSGSRHLRRKTQVLTRQWGKMTRKQRRAKGSAAVLSGELKT